jgi:diguanylate cyclase (GGDEF)-like protein
VLLVDIDHFKQVNDTHGHVVGDAVLAVVAARLRSACGSTGTVARWGGEEFIAIALDVDDTALGALAEQLRVGVSGAPLAVGGVQPVAVTVSIGTSAGRAADFKDLLHGADTALYSAKTGGRDRVVAAPAGPDG